MKILAWFKQYFVKDLAEEKPTPLSKLVELTSGDLVVKDSAEQKPVSREEYLEWAKKRAYEFIERGEIRKGLDSFYSDMEKHSELRKHPFLSIGAQIVLGGGLKSKEEVEDFIQGFL